VFLSTLFQILMQNLSYGYPCKDLHSVRLQISYMTITMVSLISLHSVRSLLNDEPKTYASNTRSRLIIFLGGLTEINIHSQNQVSLVEFFTSCLRRAAHYSDAGNQAILTDSGICRKESLLEHTVWSHILRENTFLLISCKHMFRPYGIMKDAKHTTKLTNLKRIRKIYFSL
jgi:hypothetical protein